MRSLCFVFQHKSHREFGVTRQVGHYHARYNRAPGQPILNVSHRLGCDDYPDTHELKNLQGLLAPAEVDDRLLSRRDPQFGWYDAPECIAPVA